MNCRSVCSLLLPVLTVCHGFGASRVGTITASGSFQLSDARVPQSAARSLPLVSGDEIDTTNSTAMILLADASRVILEPESKLKLERTSVETVLLLERGALSFKTAPSSRLVIRALGRSMRPEADSQGTVSTRNPGAIARLAASSYFPAAQVTAAPMLRLVILEGEGAINNIRLRTAREPIVEVQDENHRPVAGATVAFLLPGNGPGGGFANGSRSINVVTDNQGRAVARGLQPNNVPGPFQIAVSASYQGMMVNAIIQQTNILGAAALSTAAIVPLVLVGAGGTAATAFALSRSGENMPISPSQP